MSVIQSLIELQEVDGRIRELEMELKDLPRRKALEQARLSGVSADLLAAKADRESADRRVRSFEENAKEIKDRLQRLKIDQTTLATNRAYQQYSVEIDLCNHNLEAAESNQLAAMDDLPTAQARIDQAQARYDSEKEGVDSFCAEIDERIAGVNAELAEAKNERIEKAKLVSNPKFLLYYERLRTKRWPVVVPLTHAGVCDGCHLVQPPSVSQLVDKNEASVANGGSENLVACTMCGRILYR